MRKLLLLVLGVGLSAAAIAAPVASGAKRGKAPKNAPPRIVATADTVYEQNHPVAFRTPLDRLLGDEWSQRRLKTPRAASDFVWVRRMHLALLGRLPTVEAAQRFVLDPSPDKDAKLIAALLADEGFADYWSLKWCDALRVKSEFPINLWPNAVYIYQRRIRQFLAQNEPYDHFVRALLEAQGSDFRVPEVNFYRATARRTAEGLAEAAALTFLGWHYDQLSALQQQQLADFFRQVAYKPTREWKEEIVYLQFPPRAATLTYPDGTRVEVAPNLDRRRLLADYLCHRDHLELARALVSRTWEWFFGRGIVTPADGLNVGKPFSPVILDFLAREFIRSGYDFRKLVAMLANSAAARATALTGSEAPGAMESFAVFPVKRLDAEVLEDTLRDLANAKFSYSSVIPEPFTYLPDDNRTITLADGSISSSFLLLFGRPARDSGILAERNNEINGKQRLYLFNSGQLYNKLNGISRRTDMRKLNTHQRIEQIYWLYYSRPPLAAETAAITAATQAMEPKERWRISSDLAWILLNTKEFLYQH